VLLTNATIAKISSNASPGPRSLPQSLKPTDAAKSTHKHPIAIMESRPLLAIGIFIVSTILSRGCKDNAKRTAKKECKAAKGEQNEWIPPLEEMLERRGWGDDGGATGLC
jgi:hypothetical protein